MCLSLCVDTLVSKKLWSHLSVKTVFFILSLSVPPLEGFVMNRVQGDYFETLLYKIFVSIDEQTNVAEVGLGRVLYYSLMTVCLITDLFLFLLPVWLSACQCAGDWPGFSEGGFISQGFRVIFCRYVWLAFLFLKDGYSALRKVCLLQDLSI